jgi:hypothetical protein
MDITFLCGLAGLDLLSLAFWHIEVSRDIGINWVALSKL